ncbi:hypothetical protein HETIRDRAFT_312261 [Heterobasidion irregulare TC 32-1]|uniref:Uncharacterized protein n=1 Tax=Heterobasidion irregulare (strain TC 32-1) TaxID=747525 RepID=W4KCH5_HETIT|nr:uncharacterized protein HETIRDRAFT_312261 [Heterobasidion irregulare TC 32-1]ETW83567.1 hypothetical protein HETIRDRAFT_312261 [Heterobasidion irregulare TC 32-1]
MEGKLFYLSSTTDVRNMDKEAKDTGCETWYLLCALDSTPQEYTKKQNVEPGRINDETGTPRCAIVDASACHPYAPSMISDPHCRADLAILVLCS